MKWLILKLIAVGILYLAVSCRGSRTSPKEDMSPQSLRDKVQDKYGLYLSASKSHQDADGFIDTDHCDSLLFSGLYGAAGADVNIEAARDATGKWHRRPLAHPECFPKDSQSEISRDMYLGLLWYIWEYQRLDLAEDLFAYGEENNWIMGEGLVSRTYFTPGLQATLAELIYRLGGENHYVYRSTPQSYAKNDGFAAHLDALHILLRAKMMGEIEDKALEIVAYNYNRMPSNPLFAYAYHLYVDGDQTYTMGILLNEAYFPADRLPTTHDRCESWLSQRDVGPDWEPCGLDQSAKEHSGGDFLFVANLLLKD